MKKFIFGLLVILIGLAFWPDPRDEKKAEGTEDVEELAQIATATVALKGANPQDRCLQVY